MNNKCVTEHSLGSKLIYRIITYLRDGNSFFKWQIVDSKTQRVLSFSPGSWKTEREATQNMKSFVGLIKFDISQWADLNEIKVINLDRELTRTRGLLEKEPKFSCISKATSAFILGFLLVLLIQYLISI